MVDKEDARLQRMGLTKLTERDTFVEHEEEWGVRSHLQEALKASNLMDKKPVGNFFETSATPDDRAYVSCHLPVPIVAIKAEAWRTGADGVPVKLELDSEYDWAMEEAAEWSREYLTVDEVTHKEKYTSFKHASDPETYSVPNYFEYIPTNVRSAEKKYKTKFLQRNKEEHDWLQMKFIKVFYMVLKCNLPLTNDQKIQQHYRKVHLLSNGASSVSYTHLRAHET